MKFRDASVSRRTNVSLLSDKKKNKQTNKQTKKQKTNETKHFKKN